MSVRNLIAAAFNKDAASFEDTLNVVMQEKMAAAVQARFSPAVYEEEINLEEAEGNVSSGPAQHALSSRKEMRDHADYMKKKHGVTTKFHRGDELSYHGPKNNVKKAIMNHYDGDKELAREEHPHLFESVEHIEAEQIDEISGAKLGTYLIKARKSEAELDKKRDDSYDKPNTPENKAERKAISRTLNKRRWGYGKALDKLTGSSFGKVPATEK